MGQSALRAHCAAFPDQCVHLSNREIVMLVSKVMIIFAPFHLFDAAAVSIPARGAVPLCKRGYSGECKAAFSSFLIYDSDTEKQAEKAVTAAACITHSTSASPLCLQVPLGIAAKQPFCSSHVLPLPSLLSLGNLWWCAEGHGEAEAGCHRQRCRLLRCRFAHRHLADVCSQNGSAGYVHPLLSCAGLAVDGIWAVSGSSGGFHQHSLKFVSILGRSVGRDDRLHLFAIPLLLCFCHAHGLEESCRRGKTRAALQ